MLGAGGDTHRISIRLRRLGGKPDLERVTGPCEAVAIRAHASVSSDQDHEAATQHRTHPLLAWCHCSPTAPGRGPSLLLIAIVPIASSHGRLSARPLQHVERQRRDGNGSRRRGCGVLQETGARRQQIEQQSHAGPFAGPKPESMMVPRGARRSDQQAHPSRLGEARRFLPSWPCEFDSRHPLHRESHSQGPLRSAAVLLRDSSPRSGHYAGHWLRRHQLALEPQLFGLRRCAW